MPAAKRTTRQTKGPRRAPHKHARECKGKRRRGADGMMWESRAVRGSDKVATHHRWFRMHSRRPTAPTKKVTENLTVSKKRPASAARRALRPSKAYGHSPEGCKIETEREIRKGWTENGSTHSARQKRHYEKCANEDCLQHENLDECHNRVSHRVNGQAAYSQAEYELTPEAMQLLAMHSEASPMRDVQYIFLANEEMQGKTFTASHLRQRVEEDRHVYINSDNNPEWGLRYYESLQANIDAFLNNSRYVKRTA